jgi:hypothetical protein
MAQMICVSCYSLPPIAFLWLYRLHLIPPHRKPQPVPQAGERQLQSRDITFGVAISHSDPNPIWNRRFLTTEQKTCLDSLRVTRRSVALSASFSAAASQRCFESENSRNSSYPPPLLCSRSFGASTDNCGSAFFHRSTALRGIGKYV